MKALGGRCLAAAALLTCLAGYACTMSTQDANVSGPTGPTSSLPAHGFTIDVAEINGPYSFYPSAATVGFGQIIVWRNYDTVSHHVLFDDMSVDTGTLAPGTLSQPFTVSPGTRTYHCVIHPTMVGSVTVQAAFDRLREAGEEN